MILLLLLPLIAQVQHGEHYWRFVVPGGVDLTNSGVWYHCLYLAATWHKMFHTVSHKCYELAHAAHCHYLLHSLSRCVTSRILEKMSLVGSSLLSIISVKAQHCSWSIITGGRGGEKKKQKKQAQRRAAEDRSGRKSILP